MFLGQYLHSLDDKGRISIPASFRKVVQGSGADRVVLTRSKDACLIAYSVEAWDALLAEWSARPSLDPQLEAFERIYAANAWPTPMDAQGRILVPSYLREYAQLEKDVVFAGRLKKFELWQPKLWEDAVRRSSELLAAGSSRDALLPR